MKTITIDFTKTPAEISDKILGHQGEHNRTRLVITPPAEMAEDPNIISYAVCYQVGAHKVAHSEICDKADTITVLIERKVSKTNVISLQLEGYDGEENLLVLSDRITDLVFEPSATGEEYDGGNESALAEQVAYIKNKVENSEPTGSGKSFKTIILNNVMAFEIGSSDGIELIVSSDQLKVGTEIKTVRFLYDGKKIDIHNLMEVDGMPYILNMGTVYISPTVSATSLGIISKVYSNEGTFFESFIINKLLNFQIPEIEVDYYE